MNSAKTIVLGSLLLVGVLSALLLLNSSRDGTDGGEEPLVLYCAAGLKPAVEPALEAYEATTGTRVQAQYAGSGTLLGNLKVAKTGDLFLAADSFFLTSARDSGLVAEIVPIAELKPVIAVARGNPKGVSSLADLVRPDIRLVLPNPEAAAIGQIARAALNEGWEPLAARARTFKPTVNDLANDLKLGSADASILWDSTAAQYHEIDVIPGEFFGDASSEVGVGVLTFSKQPKAALKLARFLSAPDKGQHHFEAEGFQTVPGDKWVDVPELVFFSGGVNRVAIEETLRNFEEREGVRISRIYNGCGILTAQIRAGQKPDGYFACDVSFMRTVADGFRPSIRMAETSMVIATQPGNPHGLHTIADLGQSGLKIGVANEEQSALGALTARLLRGQNLFDQVMANVVVQTPTADLLVNQLRAGGLDAVVVYEANTVAAGDQIQVLPIDLPGATAIQPIAIRNDTEFPRLMERLLEALRSTESKTRFTLNGFRWHGDMQP